MKTPKQQTEERNDYTLIRSDRRTFALEVAADGTILVRAPRFASQAQIDAMLAEKAGWLAKAVARAVDRDQAAADAGLLSAEDLKALAARAKEYLPGRVQHFAAALGVDYGRITVRAQRSRWGSCSARGNLNFNCLLMLTPPEVIDSVVVHELCHRKHMDHSRAFYADLRRVYPDYDRCRAWLKREGPVLLARVQK